jgi:hypothetical protein
MRRYYLLGAVLSLGLAAFVLTAPGASSTPSAYYPDLQTVVPHQLQLVNSQKREILRFTNGFTNLGGGPLAIRPDFQPTVTVATQEIWDPSGNVVEEHPAGSYEYHPEHHHWHIADVALFQVHSGSETGPLVGSGSTKVGFCLIDWYKLDDNAKTPERTFWSCAEGYQGASVGWVDQYHQQLAGQSVELTGVPDGVYWLTSTANPLGVFRETRYDNNTAWIKFELYSGRTGNRKIRLLEHSPCDGPGMCGENAPNR